MKKIGMMVLAAGTAVVVIRASGQTAPATEQPPCTRITLAAQGVPLRQVLGQLQAQAGIFFRISGDERPITLNVTDQPLWEVFGKVLEQSNTRAWVMNDSLAVGYANYSGKASAMGPYLVLAKRIVHEVDYRPEGDPVDRCTLELQVAIDKAAAIAYYTPVATVDRAVDESNNSLIPPASAAGNGAASQRPVPVFRSFFHPFVPSIAVPLQAPMNGPGGRSAHTLKLLEGRIPAELVTKSETHEIPYPPPAGDQVVDGIVVNVTGGGTDTVNVNLTIRNTGNDPQWSVRVGATRCRLVDALGNGWAFQIPTQGITAQNVSLRYSFTKQNMSNPNPRPAGAAVKLLIDVITETKAVDIPFRFENLPLP